MALSGRDLRWYVETGKLRIVPVQDDQFQQNGIDLILEQVSERNTLSRRVPVGLSSLGRSMRSRFPPPASTQRPKERSTGRRLRWPRAVSRVIPRRTRCSRRR